MWRTGSTGAGRSSHFECTDDTEEGSNSSFERTGSSRAGPSSHFERQSGSSAVNSSVLGPAGAHGQISKQGATAPRTQFTESIDRYVMLVARYILHMLGTKRDTERCTDIRYRKHLESGPHPASKVTTLYEMHLKMFNK